MHNYFVMSHKLGLHHPSYSTVFWMSSNPLWQWSHRWCTRKNISCCNAMFKTQQVINISLLEDEISLYHLAFEINLLWTVINNYYANIITLCTYAQQGYALVMSVWGLTTKKFPVSVIYCSHIEYMYNCQKRGSLHQAICSGKEIQKHFINGMGEEFP